MEALAYKDVFRARARDVDKLGDLPTPPDPQLAQAADRTL